MNSLTKDQQAKLDAVLAELETLPTQELIVEAVRIRNLDWGTDEGKALYRTALASGIAGHKIMSYLLALRDFELFRTTLGEAIHASRSRPQPSRHEYLEEYVRDRLIAAENSGLQKVVVHFYCSCVMHLHKLLKKAAEGAEYEIPGEDLDVLNAYRGLRNYFEHIENRLPGQVNATEWVRETITENDWHIEVGLEVDNEGRTVLKG